MEKLGSCHPSASAGTARTVLALAPPSPEWPDLTLHLGPQNPLAGSTQDLGRCRECGTTPAPLPKVSEDRALL